MSFVYSMDCHIQDRLPLDEVVVVMVDMGENRHVGLLYRMGQI